MEALLLPSRSLIELVNASLRADFERTTFVLLHSTT